MTRKNNRALYQLKVTLQEIHPPIWRRVQIGEDATLAQLHRALQIIMGWEDSHLHEFSIGRRIYSVPDPDDDLYERKVIDEKRVRLKEATPRVRPERWSDITSSTRRSLKTPPRSLTPSRQSPKREPSQKPSQPSLRT